MSPLIPRLVGWFMFSLIFNFNVLTLSDIQRGYNRDILVILNAQLTVDNFESVVFTKYFISTTNFALIWMLSVSHIKSTLPVIKSHSVPLEMPSVVGGRPTEKQVVQ